MSTLKQDNQNIELEEGRSDENSVWIFGYGSLLWKINFPYQSKVVGHVKGYSRKFWQGSDDHRGVPGAPGRVVTMVEDSQECTWGVAYRVNPSDIADVLAYLNHREKGGYTTKQLLFYPSSETTKTKAFHTLMYIATESNPLYLGPAPIKDIARQVVKCRGPSGCNTEYVLNLAQALREIAPSAHDEHLYSLEKHISELMWEKRKKKSNNDGGSDGEGEQEECTCNYCNVRTS